MSVMEYKKEVLADMVRAMVSALNVDTSTIWVGVGKIMRDLSNDTFEDYMDIVQEKKELGVWQRSLLADIITWLAKNSKVVN
ncbi:MAG: hypothetical protein ACW990_00125 [Promethearchaeota archaeon]